jgi:hypothetical protein
MESKVKPLIRWRGSIAATVCVACFSVVFYGWYLPDNESAKPWLWLFFIGSLVGGAVSFIDSVSATRRELTAKRDAQQEDSA